MTEQEAIELGNKLYANITNNENNIIKTNDYIEFVGIAIEALEEIQQYRAIDKPEKCRAAAEKQKAKKPIIEHEETKDCVTEIEWKCPVCGTNYIELAPCGEWCRYCGTKLDWRW